METRTKVGSLEQNLRKGAEHVTDVEGAVVGFGKQLATFKQAGPAFLTRDSCCYASTQDSGVVLAECRGVQRFEPLFAGPTVLRASQWRHSWHVPPKRVQRTRENKMIPIVQRMSHMLYVGLTRSSEY